jgi:hypothetical protein
MLRCAAFSAWTLRLVGLALLAASAVALEMALVGASET